MPSERRQRIALPPKPFLYTLDQIGALLSVESRAIKKFVWYRDIDTGRCPPHMMRAVDISSPESGTHEWRVAEDELKRWLSQKGFGSYTRK